MKRRILFVGQDDALCNDFRQRSVAAGTEWVAKFAGSWAETLTLINEFDFHAVVADIQLPDTDGVALLDEIMRRQPQAVRVVLSDMGNPTNTLQCVGRAHRHLLKPCDAGIVNDALNQALALETWLPGAAVQKLMPQMRWVPSPPSIYFKVLQEIRSPNASVETIGELIAQDPAITAKVLQLANSAVFGLQLQVVQPIEAVSYIGLETTTALVLLAHSFSTFEPLKPSVFSVDALWRHSLATGHFARAVALSENCAGELSAQAFAAGLLHDIGKLLFAANMPTKYAEAVDLAQREQRPLWDAETQVIGACHAEVGGALLGIWGLPSPIVEAVALHHAPARRVEKTFSPLTAVHVANILDHEAEPEVGNTNSELALDYLNAIGLDDRVEEWRRACLEPAIG
jgi:HD-like signal output (HDOD) protein